MPASEGIDRCWPESYADGPAARPRGTVHAMAVNDCLGVLLTKSLDRDSPSQVASRSARERPLAPACHGLIGHVTGTALPVRYSRVLLAVGLLSLGLAETARECS